MLLAVLSDIHGNLPALEAVLDALSRRRVDGYILAGDFTGGPQVNETLALLRPLRPWAIKGNSDINLIKYDQGSAPASWYTSKQFALLRWAHRHISPSNLEYLKGLSEQIEVFFPGKASIRVVHGSPRDPFESIFPDQDPGAFESALAQISENMCIFGHTHLPWQQDWLGKQALNPGAVCGALNGDVRAQYALLTWEREGWMVELNAVSYNLSRSRRAFEDSGLLDEGGALAKAFLLSIETGENVGGFFLSHANQSAAEAGYGSDPVVPDPIWDQAAQTFDWFRFVR